MWPYLEVGTLQMQSVKMTSLQWVLIQYKWCLYKMGEFGHRHAHRENAMWRQKLKCCVYKPRNTKDRQQTTRSCWKVMEPMSLLRRKQPYQHLSLGSLSLQICETINFSCLSHPAPGTVLQQPLKLMWSSSLEAEPEMEFLCKRPIEGVPF